MSVTHVRMIQHYTLYVNVKKSNSFFVALELISQHVDLVVTNRISGDRSVGLPKQLRVCVWVS